MAKVREQVLAIAGFTGVEGCALVEAGSGMVWYSAGAADDIEPLGEAAVEFWRMHGRLTRNFAGLGDLSIAALSFEKRMLALTPCCADPALVLVTITRRDQMDWHGWHEQVRILRELLATHPP